MSILIILPQPKSKILSEFFYVTWNLRWLQTPCYSNANSKFHFYILFFTVNFQLSEPPGYSHLEIFSRFSELLINRSIFVLSELFRYPNQPAATLVQIVGSLLYFNFTTMILQSWI